MISCLNTFVPERKKIFTSSDKHPDPKGTNNAVTRNLAYNLLETALKPHYLHFTQSSYLVPMNSTSYHVSMIS